MRKVSQLLMTALVGIASAWAQGQVATVTSSAPFTLRGASITPGQGVPFWGVLQGDVVHAGSALTIVTFPDGSVITLDPGSEAKIDLAGTTPVFQLLICSAHYSLKSLTSVQLMERDRQVTEKNLSGALSLP